MQEALNKSTLKGTIATLGLRAAILLEKIGLGGLLGVKSTSIALTKA